MVLKRDAWWLLAALACGALLLPWLVYATGRSVLGPYAHGGAGAFYGDYFAALAQRRWSAWVLLLGPSVVVLSWRLAARRGTAEST